MSIEDFIIQFKSAVEKQDYDQVRKLADQIEMAKSKCSIALREDAKAVIVFHPKTGDIIDANPFVLSILGYNKTSIVKKTILDLHPPEQKKVIWNNYTQSAKTERISLLKIPLIKRDGSIVHLDGVISNFQQQDETFIKIDFLIPFADPQEEQEPTLKSPNKFLSVLSHELYKPIQAIIGYTSLLTERVYGSLTPNQEKTVQLIDQHASQVMNHINQLLHLTRLDSGTIAIYPEPFDLIKLVKKTLRDFQNHAEEKGLVLELKHPPEQIICTTDVDQFKEILRQLFSNAIKFTNEGVITVEIKITNNQAFICVTDSGSGLCQEKLDRFEHLFRYGDFVEQLTKESGLGLVIIKRLVDLLGMKISIANGPKNGTQITLSISSGIKTSAHYLTKKQLLEPLEKEMAYPRREHLKTILVVDDDPSTGEMLSEYIESRGRYRVLKAHSGMHAMIYLARSKPDLLIIDLNDPKRIIQYCQSLWGNEVKITVLISSDIDHQDGENLEEIGASLINKTEINFPALLRQIDQILPEPSHPLLKRA